MKQTIHLSAVDFDVPKEHYVLFCNSTNIYTFKFEMDLLNLPVDIIDFRTIQAWAHLNIDRKRCAQNYNDWLNDMIATGCDQTGVWNDVIKIGKWEYHTYELRRQSPSVNIRIFIRKSGCNVNCSIYVTPLDLPNDLRDFWHSKKARDYFEIVDFFYGISVSRPGQKEHRPDATLLMTRGFYVLPRIIGFKIFHELYFRGDSLTRIPKYMLDNGSSSWNLNVTKISGEKKGAAKPVKEVIKTPLGTINLTRPATKKEVAQQRKEAKKVKCSKLQERINRQKNDIENLKAELSAAQKACALAAESSSAATKRQNRELAELQKKMERLRAAKDNALAMKDAEIDEIQKIADEIIASGNAAKQELENADWQIQNLNAQVQGLRQRQFNTGLIAGPASESEKFAGEFEVALMSAIHFAVENVPQKANSYSQRSRDIWQAFIQANPDAEQAFASYRQNARELLASVRKNNFWKNTAMLSPLGMSCSLHANNHGKIRFIDGDRRYTGTVASTPSDTTSGPSNCADEIKNAFFYPI